MLFHSGPPCRHRILSQNFKYLFFHIDLIDKYQVSTVQKTKIDVLEKSNFHNSPKLLKLKMIWKICWKGHNYLKSKAWLTSLTFRSVLWLYQIVLCQVLRFLCKKKICSYHQMLIFGNLDLFWPIFSVKFVKTDEK